MRGTRFDPPTIKFEGSTDDSMMDIHAQIDYDGMNEFIQITITCTRRHTLFRCHRRYNVRRIKLRLHA